MCKQLRRGAGSSGFPEGEGVAEFFPSVSKYMVRVRQPPSQTWRTFLQNHVSQLVSVDFFTVPTLRFQVLYVFLVLMIVVG